jgi:glucokinase
MSLRIGVDIGGTNLRVGVVDGVRIIDEIRRTADFSAICRSHPPEMAWRHIIQITAEALQEMLKRHPQVESIGIGFPGFIDPLSGMVAQSPNLPGLKNVDLAGDLADILRSPVMVENDALAAAYGEYKLHPEAASSLIYVGLGTGVGGGLIVNHQPFTGQHGYAMEIGHLIVAQHGRWCGCGNRGCMEQYASASGVSISYEAAAGKKLAADAIAKLAQTGDQDAIAAYQLAGETLAQALAHILKVLDIKLVVIGGGMSQAWTLMKPTFEHRLDQDLIPVLRNKVAIKVSSSADQAGIVGAALLM